jgi:phosphate transport system substrate-binding protein
MDAFKAQLTADLRSSIVQPPAAARSAYPITGMTYLLIPKDESDRSKRQALKDFVQYVITSGQQLSTQMDYSQLPQVLEQIDQKLIDGLIWWLPQVNLHCCPFSDRFHACRHIGILLFVM